MLAGTIEKIACTVTLDHTVVQRIESADFDEILVVMVAYTLLPGMKLANSHSSFATEIKAVGEANLVSAAGAALPDRNDLVLGRESMGAMSVTIPVEVHIVCMTVTFRLDNSRLGASNTRNRETSVKHKHHTVIEFRAGGIPEF